MIRFTCDTCGRSLRAPEKLAGKRGKCARCGGVNRVPAAAVSVDVRRAVEPSPFRNADRPTRGAVEGAIELAGKRFLTVTPSSTAVEEIHDPRDFFDQVASHISAARPQPFTRDVAAPAAPAAPPPRRPPPIRGRGRHHPLENRAPHTGDSYEVRYDHQPQEFARAVSAALVVGAVVGFCVGLVASKWLL
jgi:hypothetical protein